MSAQLRCFISIGEHSGDLLAAQLVRELKEHIPALEFYGIAGDAMRKAGVEQLVPMDALSVMGLFDVINKSAEIKLTERRVLDHLDRRSPQLAILVDYPGFHFRLA